MSEGLSINLRRRLFVTTDGDVMPIVELRDSDNEIVDDPDEAEDFIAGPDRNGRWWRDTLASYDRRPN